MSTAAGAHSRMSTESRTATLARSRPSVVAPSSTALNVPVSALAATSATVGRFLSKWARMVAPSTAATSSARRPYIVKWPVGPSITAAGLDLDPEERDPAVGEERVKETDRVRPATDAGRQQHARQCAEHGIPFVFDPGQGLPLFSGGELLNFLTLADCTRGDRWRRKGLGV